MGDAFSTPSNVSMDAEPTAASGTSCTTAAFPLGENEDGHPQKQSRGRLVDVEPNKTVRLGRLVSLALTPFRLPLVYRLCLAAPSHSLRCARLGGQLQFAVLRPPPSPRMPRPALHLRPRRSCVVEESSFGTEMPRLKWRLHTQRVKYVEQLVK